MAAGMKRKIVEVEAPMGSALKKSVVREGERGMKKDGRGGEEEGGAMPSVKDLASSDPKLRRHALQKIMSHLKSRSPTPLISNTEALHLWRGFSVALYMHDSRSAISVQNLITELAGTFDIMYQKDLDVTEDTSDKVETNTASNGGKIDVEEDEWNGLDDDDTTTTTNNNNNNTSHNDDASDPTFDPLTTPLPPTNLTTWSTAFWTTMTREWSTIDSHRLNKYLLLVRLVLRQTLSICVSCSLPSSPSPNKQEKDGGDDVPTSQLALLSLLPLNPRNHQTPNGLKLHVVDIYVDELDTAFSHASSSSAQTQNDNDDDGSNDEVSEDRKIEIQKRLMAPMRRVAKHGLAKVVRVRAREEVERISK